MCSYHLSPYPILPLLVLLRPTDQQAGKKQGLQHALKQGQKPRPASAAGRVGTQTGGGHGGVESEGRGGVNSHRNFQHADSAVELAAAEQAAAEQAAVEQAAAEQAAVEQAAVMQLAIEGAAEGGSEGGWGAGLVDVQGEVEGDGADTLAPRATVGLTMTLARGVSSDLVFDAS